MSSTIVSRFLDHARERPAKPFLIVETPHERAAISFAAMHDLARRRGAEIIASGAAPGGVVLIFLPQGSLALSYFIGAMMAGYIPSFMPCPSAKQDPEHYWQAHRKLFQRILPAALVTDAGHAAHMVRFGLVSTTTLLITAGNVMDAGAFEPRAADPGDTAFLQHSSGTTGLKKGVMLSHEAVLRQIQSYSTVIGATGDDVVVSWLPVYHDMGLIACFIMPMVLGQTLVILDPFHWVSRPATLFRAIAAHAGTLCWLPNFAFEHLVNLVRPEPAAMKLDSMRAFINCSEPCRADSFVRFAERFEPLGVHPGMLQTCYALAEAVFAASQTAIGRPARTVTVDRQALEEEMRIAEPAAGRPAAVLLSNGPPVPHTTISVRDSDGRLLGDKRAGEIWIESDFLFSGYYRLPEETAEKLKGGACRTSDRGVMIDGEVYVLGRLDDLLIINGRNFHAAEIEGLLGGIAGLKPGRNVAFTRYNRELGGNELIVVCERTASFSQPMVRAAIRKSIFDELGLHSAEIAVVEPGWLSKTTSGKIARGLNAERYAILRRQTSSGD